MGTNKEGETALRVQPGHNTHSAPHPTHIRIVGRRGGGAEDAARARPFVAPS